MNTVTFRKLPPFIVFRMEFKPCLKPSLQEFVRTDWFPPQPPHYPVPFYPIFLIIIIIIIKIGSAQKQTKKGSVRLSEHSLKKLFGLTHVCMYNITDLLLSFTFRRMKNGQILKNRRKLTTQGFAFRRYKWGKVLVQRRFPRHPQAARWPLLICTVMYCI